MSTGKTTPQGGGSAVVAAATTIHVGDPHQPVRQVIYVHAEPAAPAEPTGAWLSADAAAKRLGVSRSTVSRLVSTGALAPSRKLGAKLQVHVDALDAYERDLPSAKKDTDDVDDVRRDVRQALRLAP